MALQIVEGFDQFMPAEENSVYITTAAAIWNLFGSVFLVNGLHDNIPGRAIQVYSGGACSRLNQDGSIGRCMGYAWIRSDRAGTRAGVTLRDNATDQVSITVESSTGALNIRTGGIAGTILQSYAAGIASNAVHHIRWDITHGASSSYEVWLDGTSVLSGTGATKASANSTSDRLTIQSTGVVHFTVDSLITNDTAGSEWNAPRAIKPAVETSYALGDVQTEFTAGQVLLLAGAERNSGSQSGPGANVIWLFQIRPETDCNLDGISVRHATTIAGAKMKAVCYADSGNSPNGQSQVGSTGTEVTGTTAGAVVNLPFGSPIALTGGTKYWIGYITDSATRQYTATHPNSLTTLHAANTYASGAPATCPTMSSTSGAYGSMWGYGSGAAANWVALNYGAQAGGESLLSVHTSGTYPYAASATATDQDIQEFAPLCSQPGEVYGVAVAAFLDKSDGGTRTADLKGQSGASESAGSNSGFAVTTAPVYYQTFFPTDPNGGGSWTAAAAEAFTAGAVVAT